MSGVLTAAAIMAGLGLFFAIILTVSYRFLRVAEDPRLEKVEGALPSTNCGACGEAGCHAFAEALLEGRKSPSGCTVSSPEAVDLIAEMLGVDAGEAVKRVARLHCAGGTAQASQIAAYAGHATCSAAAIVGGGGKACSWGCLGLADCEVACTFDAIKMNDNGLPVVVVDLCTACGDCVTACPRDLFEILPLTADVVVQCSATLSGDEAMAVCSVACDACGRCAQDAPGGLIKMVNNLPVVDFSGHGPAGPNSTLRCPTGAIAWLGEGGQFEEVEPVRRRSHG